MKTVHVERLDDVSFTLIDHMHNVTGDSLQDFDDVQGETNTFTTVCKHGWMPGGSHTQCSKRPMKSCQRMLPSESVVTKSRT